MRVDPQDFIKRLEKLQGYRTNFDSQWDQINKIVWIDSEPFLSQRSVGEQTTRYIYETTAAAALEKFASAMESFLIPRHMRWHGLRATVEELMKNREVKVFFETLTQKLFKLREDPKARFYSQMHEGLKSLGAYGNACIYVDQQSSKRGLQYRYVPVAQTWVATNHLSIVDTVFHKYRLTAKAAAQKWPHQVPEKAARALESGQILDEQEYLHVVQPNDPTMVDPESVLGKDQKFLSYHIALDSKEIIRESENEEVGGFEQLPYLWTRYSVNMSETYGRGPAMFCLPDIKTLQEMEKTMMRSGHKVADPPLLVAHDGRLGRGQRKIRLEPGGLNYGGVDESGRAKIIPLQTGARLDLTLELMDRKRDTINDFFLVKLFDILAQDRVEMTATEVLERSKEKAQLITPVVGRQQSELLGPMIEREISLMQSMGMVPEIPEALAEARGSYQVQYDSLATRMQQADEVAAWQRLIEVFTPLGQVDPAIIQVLNGEDAIRIFGENMGVRSTLFKTEQEMKDLRDAQAKQLQDQQQVENAPQIASAMKDAAQAQHMSGGAGGGA